MSQKSLSWVRRWPHRQGLAGTEAA